MILIGGLNKTTLLISKIISREVMYLLDGPFWLIIAGVVTALTIVLVILRLSGKAKVSWWTIGPLLVAETGFWGFIVYVRCVMVAS